MNIYGSNVVDKYDRPISDAEVWVYRADNDQLADLFGEDEEPIANPVNTGKFGEFEFRAADGVYRIDYRHSSELLYREVYVTIGEGFPPQEVGAEGLWDPEGAFNSEGLWA